MDLEQKYTLSVQALKDYAQQAGFNEVVLGLSGGIDSGARGGHVRRRVWC